MAVRWASRSGAGLRSFDHIAAHHGAGDHHECVDDDRNRQQLVVLVRGDRQSNPGKHTQNCAGDQNVAPAPSLPSIGNASVTIPAKGLKYHAKPAQKKKAALAVRSTCKSFFNRFWSGMRPSIPESAPEWWPRLPAAITMAAWVRARSRCLSLGWMLVAVAMTFGVSRPSVEDYANLG